MIIGIMAYTIWGLLPLYLKQFSGVSASEILIHRVVWALPFGFFIIYLRQQWHEVQETIKNKRKLGWLALAAFAISINWLIYLWAVNSDRIFEASLGYYINPLMYVIVGVIFFKEKLVQNVPKIPQQSHILCKMAYPVIGIFFLHPNMRLNSRPRKKVTF